MRRTTALVGALLITLLVSGCGTPQPRAVWRTPPPSPTTDPHLTPAVGTCHMVPPTEVHRLSDEVLPVDCAATHTTETFHVGAFSDAAAAAIKAGNWEPALTAAFTSCAPAVPDFLGGDWRAARVALTWFFPTPNRLARGARWIRCDMYEEATLGERAAIARTGSFRDGLRGTRPLAITCATHISPDDRSVADIRYIACQAPHTIEFTGTFVAGAPTLPFPGDREVGRRALAGCKNAGVRYLGASVRTGMMWVSSGPSSRANWERGDRIFRCFLGVDNNQRLLRGSIRALGNRPLPR